MITVPGSVDLQHAEDFLACAEWTLEEGAELPIHFDGGEGIVEPWALAALGAFSLAAGRHDMRLDVTGLEAATEPTRMGMSKFFGQGADPDVEPAGRYIFLRQIKFSPDLGPVFADIVPLLHLADEPRQAQAVQYSISEMVRNVLEHSRSEDGAVLAAEHYPADAGRQARVNIGIADCGLGIRFSLSRNFRLENDFEALLTAIRPGSTGALKSHYGGPSDNAGAGLFYMRRLTATADGLFGLISGDALLRSTPADAERMDEGLVVAIPRFPGTVVSVEIGIEEPFEWAEFIKSAGAAFAQMTSRSAQRAARKARFE